MGDPIEQKLHDAFNHAKEAIPDLAKIADYVANTGADHCIIAACPTTTELEDGTASRTCLPIFWGTKEECDDLGTSIKRITDWTLSVY